MAKKEISVVIPVFNEEKTVAQIIRALMKTAVVNELIFVNDGSKDKSQKILKSFGNKIKLINFEKNRGKGYAMAVGVRKAKSEIIVFLDSDLVNLKPEHVEKLAAPLLTNQADVVLAEISSLSGLFGPWTYFSGQRAYWRQDLLPHLKELARTRYGAEVFLNKAFKKKKKKIIKLKDLSYVLKRQKMDSSKLPSVYLKEYLDITRTIARMNGMSEKNKARLKKLKSFLKGEKIESVEGLFGSLGKPIDKKSFQKIKEYFLSQNNKWKIKF